MFSFWHPSFAEYLAAVEVARRPAAAVETLVPFREEASWREVVVLAVGCISQTSDEVAGEVLLELAERDPPVDEPILHRMLELAGRCLADRPYLGRAKKEELLRRLARALHAHPRAPLASALVTVGGEPGLALRDEDTIIEIASSAKGQSEGVRLMACVLLGRCAKRSPAALAFCQTLAETDDSQMVRLHALLALVSAGVVTSERVCEHLAEWPGLDRSTGSLAWFWAIATLEWEHAPDDPMLHVLRQCLDSPVARAQLVAAALLANTDHRAAAVDRLVQLLNSEVSDMAVAVLRHVGLTSGAAPTVTHLLTGDDPGRAAAYTVLEHRRLGPAEQAALRALLSHERAQVRAMAASLLVRPGQDEGRQTLAELLTDAHPGARLLAARAVLDKRHPSEEPNEEAIAVLVALAAHPLQRIRHLAVDRLARLEAPGDEQAAALARSLGDVDEEHGRLRDSLHLALRRSRLRSRLGDSARATLAPLLEHPDPWMRRVAVEMLLPTDRRQNAILVLARLAASDGAARHMLARETTDVSILAPLLAHRDPDVRAGAGAALWSQLDGRVSSEMVGRFANPEPDDMFAHHYSGMLTRLIAEPLTSTIPNGAVDELVELLRGSPVKVRFLVASLLIETSRRTAAVVEMLTCSMSGLSEGDSPAAGAELPPGLAGALLPVLEHGGHRARVAAAGLLVRSDRAGEAERVLVGALHDADDRSRYLAAVALVDTEHGDAAVTTLRSLLVSGSPEVSFGAAHLLRGGPHRVAAVATIARLARLLPLDTKHAIAARTVAERVAGADTDEAVLADLHELLADDDDATRLIAATLLRDTDHDEDASAALLRLVASPNAETDARTEAARHLRDSDLTHEVMDGLVDMVARDDEIARTLAGDLLRGRTLPPGAASHLLGLLETAGADAISAIVWQLRRAELGPDELARLARLVTDPAIMVNAGSLLSHVEARRALPEPVIDTVIRHVGSDSPDISGSAVAVLRSATNPGAVLRGIGAHLGCSGLASTLTALYERRPATAAEVREASEALASTGDEPLDALRTLAIDLLQRRLDGSAAAHV